MSRVPTLPVSESRLSSIDAIDLKTIAQTTLYTVPAGKSLVATRVVIRITSATGGTIGATVTVGANGGFNDLITATVTGLLTASQYGILSPVAITGVGSKVFVAGDVIRLNVTVGATATTLIASCDLFGYLI